MSIERWNEKASFIWSVADLLRGPYRPNQYKDVMLPMLVLRRLDCVLAPTKEAVLAKNAELEQRGRTQNAELVLNEITGHRFHNTSKFTFEKLKGEPDKIAENLVDYIAGFSKQAKDIIEHFAFEEQIAKLDKADRLFLILSKFCEVDLHPSKVSNRDMGYLFEELIRRFNEASNEEAGDHFTPREVIRLMVNLLFAEDDAVLTTPGIIRTLYDPACGTGGMLSVAEEYVEELNPEAELKVFGQDYNAQAYAICGSDLLIKGQDPANVHFGDSFTDDYFASQRFDYMLANPPFGVDWKAEQAAIEKEHNEKGDAGRFGAGLPPINDGALLFLQHMIAKMKDPAREGSRIGIVFSGSPLFSGSAGSGPSSIRKWIIENDWLEAIVAMPDQLFYNTGIATYVWIVTNRKAPGRQGKVQLIDGRTFYRKMRKSLGNKRNEIGEDQCRDIVRLYGAFGENEFVRVLDNEDFGYRRVTVEQPLRLNFAVTDERLARVREAPAFANLAGSRKRKDTALIAAEEEAGRQEQATILAALETLRPLGVMQSRDVFTAALKAALRRQRAAVPAPVMKAVLAALSERDETAEVCRDAKGNPEPDPELRDFENVPLKEDVAGYLAREVLPHAHDAWVDESKIKIGYEINFNRYFYRFTPPRPLGEIETDIREVERLIALLQEKRVAMISHAATKGRDSLAPMKDSGIAWIGQVPAHWPIVKLKNVASLHSGHTPSRQHPEYWENCTIPWISLGDVWQLREGRKEYIEETKEMISELGLQHSAAELLPAGTVILSRTASVGFSGIMAKSMATTQDYANWVCGPKILPEYLLQVLRCMKPEFDRLTLGSTHQTIYMPDIEAFRIPLPPVTEQQKIVQYIRSLQTTGEKLEDAIGDSAALLREYRSAAISAAVTGKIEVRDEVPA